MSNVDTAEAAMAVIGIHAVISREVEKVSGKDRRRIRKLDQEITFRVREMLDGNLTCDYPLPNDYDKLLKDLTEPFNEEQIGKTIAFLPEDVKMPFMAIASNAYKDMQNAIPKHFLKTIAGVRQLSVDDPSYFHFHWLYSVLNDPLRAINLMAHGALFRDQAELIHEIFPSIADKIDEVIDDIIPDKKAKDNEWEVPFETDIGIRVWRSLPVIQGEYQTMYASQQEVKDMDPQPSKSQLSNTAAASVSGADATLYTKAT
jgi:hypothetical protein